MATGTPDEPDPFRAPMASIRPPAMTAEFPEAEAIRRTYLAHEAAVRSLGSLWNLAATFAVIGFVTYAFAAFRAVDLTGRTNGGMAGSWSLSTILAGVALVLVAICSGMAYGLDHLRAWARWATVPIAAGACLWATLGVVHGAMYVAYNPVPLVIALTLFSVPAYILYLLLSASGTMVFSREYREIIRQTPDLRYKTSRGLKIALASFVLLVVAALIMFVVVGVHIARNSP